MTDYTSIFNTAIGALPGILALIRANHTSQNPDAPALTDDQVLEALAQAVASSIAKDEAWLAANPPRPTDGGPTA
jgi:uncharacterized protein (DUF362 family)